MSVKSIRATVVEPVDFLEQDAAPRQWHKSGRFWISFGLWIVLLVNLPFVVATPFIAMSISHRMTDIAEHLQKEGDANGAAVKEREAYEIHYDQLHRGNAAWVCIGLTLVGFAVLHGRRI